MKIPFDERKGEKTELEFTCPLCRSNEICEHIVLYEPVVFYGDNSFTEYGTKWGEPANVRYTCLICGWQVRDEDGSIIKDDASLTLWLMGGCKPPQYPLRPSGQPVEDVAKKQALMFRCPVCGGHVLEGIGCAVGSLKVYDDGSTLGDDFHEAGPLSYHCHDCGFLLVDKQGEAICEPKTVVEWLQSSCATGEDE